MSKTEKAMKTKDEVFSARKSLQTNPNETHGYSVAPDDERERQLCPVCRIEKESWSGNQGEGVLKEDQTYCCRGCAEGSGCTCSGDEVDRSFIQQNKEGGENK